MPSSDNFRLTADQRFTKYAKKSNGCWLWTGPKTVHGRPVLNVYRKGQPRLAVYAHRWAYERFKGKVTKGMCVCHKCDVPLCVRPSHLFLGTQDDNMKDMVAKNRQNRPKGTMNGRAILDDDDVRYIRKSYKFRGGRYSQRGLAASFGVCVRTIQEILNRKKWAHVE